MGHLNYTKIIATVGPASSSVETIRQLIRSGADGLRLNFSHGDGPKLRPLMERAREAALAEGRHVPIIADIQGPKLRVGHMPKEGVTLFEGKRFTITGREVEGTEACVHSPYEYLTDDVEVGTRILLADGIIELEVESVDPEQVHCRVITGGRLYANKGLNIPGRSLSVATLTDKDHRDLKYLSETDVDIVAISFVRCAADVEAARRVLGENCRVPVMAKLERPEALDNLDEILEASDGIMVARGDLGVELPFHRVPILQKQILHRAALRGKWAIVATQMLGSMVLSRRPSRAEASDVVNAVLDGSDAVMLSEETAAGDNPVQAVAAMAALTRAGEKYELSAARPDFSEDIVSFAAGAAGAAVSAAERIRARAIVILAGSGLTALLVSKWRPRIPILALSAHPASLRRLNVLRGVHPVHLDRMTDFEGQLQAADRFLVDNAWATPKDVVVVVAATPLGMHRETNTIRFHRVRSI